MKAEIISVGTELLLGHTINTDAAHVARALSSLGIDLHHACVVGDNAARLEECLRAALQRSDLIITTGGTGLSPRDVTPEATLAVLDREIRAIPVAMWVEGLKITPRAMLSRAVAGTRGRSLIINLPGSEKAARENLFPVIGALEHAMHMIAAEGHD